jgi:Ca2+-binding RTX toxin-like protein
MAVVVAFLIGCAVLLLAVGASGVQAQASKKEQSRCQGTRTIKDSASGEIYITNDIPGCPKGGLLLGTEGSDQTRSRDPARPSLSGGDGDDEIRGLGGSDWISHGSGDDVIYGGDGDDGVFPDLGNDVIYGGAGNDKLDSGDDGGDKLYCGAGRDKYIADKNDYVDSSCETNSAAGPHQSGYTGHDVIYSASASPSSVPQVLADGGGPSILLPAAALLLGSGILTYVILRRR